MSLELSVDGERWRTHLRAVAERTPGLVPVLKGNGYGFGLHRLARRAGWLGASTVAVGLYEELPEVAPRFPGDLLVLTPWRPFHEDPADPALAKRVVHTVSRPEDLPALLERRPGARFVLELATSMRRHGMTAAELWALAPDLRRLGGRLEGVALHLPLAHGGHLAEVERLLTDVVAADLPSRTVWVSHLTDAERDRLRAAYADLELRPRTGTDLWLGDRGALRVTSTVLDVHPLRRGDPYGYRGRTAPRDGHLLVVSGGTAHGIGLEAPQGQLGLKDRARSVAKGGLDAAGLSRSPFWVDGKQRWFAEPPHMQASMLLLPQGAGVPEVGDRLDARVRYTATAFDRVVVS
ncbi:alanine racemase [Nocardioides anomalus]|uniref:Alanine racemase n=1 Tax=Nocardioides anomalus TaxID=2712223 RepID=A0A6G6WJ07_9ACTN|nr:alanine racemase [Nocardioides anomalus]QIG45209.1 alanine racemase [Nocardioides anomalus]